MALRTIHNARRPGAAAVETALVMIPLLMFIFGVFEFGRMLMVWNVLNNAARVGCRFALANNTDATLATDVTTQVTNQMSGLNTTAFSSFSVTVSGTHTASGVTTTYTGNGCNNLVAGDLITVTVTGKYKFMNIIPLVTMPSNFSMSSAPTLVCEGAT
jgi:Flp pilus assembly protein TadG